MKYLTFTHPGEREANEDCCSALRFKPLSSPLKPVTSSQEADEYIDVLLLSDGMGGKEHGAAISRWTVTLIQRELLREFSTRTVLQDQIERDLSIDSDEIVPETLEQVIKTTNERVLDRIEQKNWGGGGATVVTCVVQGNKFWYSHRGDSRLYLWSEDGQELTQLTMDHTVPQILHDNEMIDAEVAKNHARQNELVFFIGSEEQPDLKTKSSTLDLGDRLLLCSDGITSKLDQERMQKILSENNLFDAADTLCSAALEAGSSDNMTVVLYEYDGSPRCENAGREFSEDQNRRDKIEKTASEKGKGESGGNAS